LRILIADDHTVVRSGLRAILGARRDWQICAEAENGIEAVAFAKRVRPDVAVVDLNMPGLNGIEASAELTKILPCIGVVVLTFDYSSALVSAILKSGALGFVMKSDADRELIAAVTAVQRGERFITRQADAVFAHSPCLSSDSFVLRNADPPNLEARAQVRLLAERMKRML
jgi:DNA-binding NarL/FixJ family response regulator